MKKRFSLLLIALCMAVAVSAQEYRKLHVYELAIGADLIVKGKITESKGGNFKVEISGVVAGNYEGSSILVKRFKNYKTVKRWGKYLVDEEVFLFLKEGEDRYEIMGLGGEGEKLIMANEVFLDSRGEGIKNRFGYQAMLIEGNIYAEKLPLEDFEAAVKGMRACFSLRYKETFTKDGDAWQEPITTQICDDKALDQYRSTSWVHEEMTKHAEKVAE